MKINTRKPLKRFEKSSYDKQAEANEDLLVERLEKLTTEEKPKQAIKRFADRYSDFKKAPKPRTFAL